MRARLSFFLGAVLLFPSAALAGHSPGADNGWAQTAYFRFLASPPPGGPGLSAQQLAEVRGAFQGKSPDWDVLQDTRDAWELATKWWPVAGGSPQATLWKHLHPVPERVLSELAREIDTWWRTELLTRKRRLRELFAHTSPQDGVSDFRFHPSFDAWRAEQEALEKTIPELERNYSAWRTVAWRSSAGGWVPSFDLLPRDVLPDCRRDMAQKVFREPRPNWGYLSEIEAAHRRACPPEVLAREATLREQMELRHNQRRTFSEAKAVFDQALWFLQAAQQKTSATFAALESCQGSASEAALCVLSLTEEWKALRAHRREARRQLVVLGALGKILNDFDGGPELVKIVTAYAKPMGELRETLDVVLAYFGAWLGEDADETMETFAGAPPRLAPTPGLRDYPLSSTSVFHYRGGPPSGVDYSVGVAPGGLPQAWGDYLRGATRSYDAARAAYKTHYPRWQASLTERFRQETGSYASRALPGATQLAADLAPSGGKWTDAEARFRNLDGKFRSKFPDLPAPGRLPSGVTDELDLIGRQLRASAVAGTVDEVAIRFATAAMTAARFARAGLKEAQRQWYDHLLLGVATQRPNVRPETLARLLPPTSLIYDTRALISPDTDRLDRIFAGLGVASSGVIAFGGIKPAIEALKDLGKATRLGRTSEEFAHALRGAQVAADESRVFASGTNAGGWRRHFDIFGARTAEEANLAFREPPYKAGTKVYELATREDQIFVRVHGPGNRERSWVMRREAIQNMSPADIASKYNIPSIPTHISEVRVPSGTRLRRGLVGSNEFGRSHGAVQYEIMDNLDRVIFGNATSIGDVVK